MLRVVCKVPPQHPKDPCFSLRSSHAQSSAGGSRIYYPSLSALMREPGLWQRSPVTHSSSSILQTHRSYKFYSKTGFNVEEMNLHCTAERNNCIKNSSSESVSLQLRPPSPAAFNGSVQPNYKEKYFELLHSSGL